MSGRDELRKRRLYRFGYFDAAGELHEVEAFTDQQTMLNALTAACEARKASGEPQFTVITVYRIDMVAPVVILTDP